VQADLLDEQILESDYAAEIADEDAITWANWYKIRDIEMGLRKAANHNSTRSAAMTGTTVSPWIANSRDWDDDSVELSEDLERLLPGNMLSDSVFSAYPFLGGAVPATSRCRQI